MVLLCRTDNSSWHGSSKRLEKLDRAVTVGRNTGICNSHLPSGGSRIVCPAAHVSAKVNQYLSDEHAVFKHSNRAEMTAVLLQSGQ